MQNVWQKSDSLYSTISNSNITVASVLSRRVRFPEAELVPKNFIEPGTGDKVYRIPYEDYIVEEEKEADEAKESFKMPSDFTVHVRKSGFNAFVKSFALFFSESQDNS